MERRVDDLSFEGAWKNQVKEEQKEQAPVSNKKRSRSTKHQHFVVKEMLSKQEQKFEWPQNNKPLLKRKMSML